MTGDDDVRGAAADPSTEEIPVVEQVAAATRTAVPDPVGAPRAALVAGSTHSLTLPRVVEGCATPKPISTTAYSTTAMTRFMNGPPSMMMTRLPTGSR